MARTPLNASALNDFDQRVKNAVPGFVQKTWNDSPPSLDTVGVQAEIDAASGLWSAGAGRQVVYLPSGDYNITYTASTVQPSGAGVALAYGLLMKSGVELIGTGRTRFVATQVPNTTLSAGPITLPQASIQVTSTASFPSAGSFQIAGTTDVVSYTSKDATHFLGCTGGTATLANGTAVALKANNCLLATHQSTEQTDFAIRNITFDLNTPLAIELDNHAIFTGPAKRYEITGCEFTGSLGKAIFIFGDTTHQPSRIKIANNYFHDLSSNAIGWSSFGMADYEIVDNLVADCRILAESFITGSNTTSLRGLISRNIIRNWGTIDVGGTDIVCSENYVNMPAGSAAPAIKVVGPARISVVNNHIDCSAATATLVGGINVQDGNTTDLVIQGNTILRNGSATAGRGISLNSTNTRVVVGDNIITGASGAAEADIAGANLTDSVIRNNVCASANGQGMFLGNTCSRLLIDGNIVTGGALVADCTDSTVSNNRVVAQAGNVTCMEVNSNSVVTGNRLKSAAVATNAGALRVFGTDSIITGNYIEQTVLNGRWIDEQTGADRNLYADNQLIIGSGTGNINLVGAASKVRRNTGYISENYGATSVADGGTVTHGLATTPTRVNVTPSVGSQMVSVTAKTATTFTVAIKTDAGAAGTTQTVYWQAEI